MLYKMDTKKTDFSFVTEKQYCNNIWYFASFKQMNSSSIYKYFFYYV